MSLSRYPRFRQSLAGLMLLLILNTAQAQGPSGEWPQLRGPAGNGIAPGKAPTKWSQTENLAWKVELPGRGTSTPIVVGGKIFLTCYTGTAAPGQETLQRTVACLDFKDGKLLWQQEVPSKLPEQPRIREEHGYASNTPVSDGERLYVFFGKSGVFAFDLAGKQLWHADVGDKLNGWGSAASLILHQDLVIVNASVESESLVALDRKTGKEVWRAGGIRESWATPILVPAPGGKTELIVPIQGKILAFNPATGEALWNCATDITWYMVPCPVAHEGIVYSIGGRSGVAALAVKVGGSGNVTKTNRLWTANKGSNVSSPIYYEGHLYWVNDSSGTAYCADPKTGAILYEERLPRAEQFYAAAVLSEGRLYYTDRRGQTFVLAAKPKFELIATNDLSDRTIFNASPVVVGNHMLLRSDRFLYCVGQK